MKHHIHATVNTPRSYAALILLQKLYARLERRAFAKARKSFLKKQLAISGKLTCHYCGNGGLEINTLSKSKIATIDHIVPIQSGGSLLDETNFVVCCPTCNRRKAAQSYQEFKESKYVQRKRETYGTITESTDG